MQDRHVGMTYLTTLPTEWNQGWALTSLELPGSLAQLLLPQPVGFAGLLPASPKASQVPPSLPCVLSTWVSLPHGSQSPNEAFFVILPPTLRPTFLRAPPVCPPPLHPGWWVGHCQPPEMPPLPCVAQNISVLATLQFLDFMEMLLFVLFTGRQSAKTAKRHFWEAKGI